MSRAVVALTKADTVTDVDGAASAVRMRLKESPFAEASIVPTSAPRGLGLDELKAALVRMLAEAPRPADIGKPRLPLDRVFTLKGVGTVGGRQTGHATAVGRRLAGVDVYPGTGLTERLFQAHSGHRSSTATG